MFKSKRIACISDIHLGVHKDTQLWHDQHMNLAHWLKESLIENSINDIIIAGDIFHNRYDISVSTLHKCKEFFNVLKDFNIVAITGNHDCYYRDNSKINSIKVLEGNNFNVFDSSVKVVKFNSKIFAFCPWGTGIEDIPECDVVIGHFEIKNFKMASNHICDDGWDGGNLLDKCKKVLTGHFHTRDERVYENNKTILYLGSPLELDWGDRDGAKGYTILNTNDLSLTFIENTVSSKHIKIRMSDIQSGRVTIQQIKDIIPNNFVKVVVDVKFSESGVDALIAKLNILKPKHLKVDYEISEQLQESEIIKEDKIVSVVQVMQEYVNVIDTDVSKKLIFDKCVELYQKFQNTNE
jgi:DNA repair exonuclease SbcCD nuclease subunit